MNALTFEVNIPLGIVIAILATVSLNVGKGVQRLGAETLGKGMLKKWKTNPEEKRKIVLWLVGTSMTAISMILAMVAALFLDRSSTSVAISGIGILSVVIFAVYVIKEKISTLQVIAIFIIIGGTLVLGIQYEESVKALPNVEFYIFTLIITIIGTSTAIVSIKLNKAQGIVFGILAGVFNGFGSIAALFATSTGDNELGKSIVNIWTVTGILTGQGAFWFTQYSFKKGGKAALIVPLMSSFQLLIPLITDATIYKTPFGPFQIISFAANLLGIVILSLSSSTALNRFIATPAEIGDAEEPIPDQGKSELTE